MEEQEVKQAMERMIQLKNELKKIDDDKKKIATECKPVRQKVFNNLKTIELDELESDKCVVQVVKKSQMRKRTNKLTYEAILNVLGENDLREIKDYIEKNRSVLTERQVSVIPIGSMRKTRSDCKNEKREKPEMTSAQKFLHKLQKKQLKKS